MEKNCRYTFMILNYIFIEYIQLLSYNLYLAMSSTFNSKFKNGELTFDEFELFIEKLASECKLKKVISVINSMEKKLGKSVTSIQKRIWYNNYIGRKKHSNTNEITDEKMYEEFRKYLYNGHENLINSIQNFSFAPKSKLKVGFVSADFRTHVVMQFFSSLLPKESDNVDTSESKLEFTLYSNLSMQKEDHITKKIKDNKNIIFKNITCLSSVEACDFIKKDGIDILVDLSGITAGNRLDVFALRAAPIQISWLGYANTSGLHTISYRLTDRIADPPNTKQFFTEKLVYINGDAPFLCFNPEFLSKYPPIEKGPPVVKNGFITFGCFNNLAKISRETIECWCGLLKSVKNSKLKIKSNWSNLHKRTQAHLKRQFSLIGKIDSSRLIFDNYDPTYLDHYSSYLNVDIALDCFPYSGTTTTCDLLNMGIPLVTMRTNSAKDHRHSHNVSASILSRIPSVSNLIAISKKEFIAKGKALAENIKLLGHLRHTLRQEFQSSSICNQVEFRKNFENTLLDLWNKSENVSIIDTSLNGCYAQQNLIVKKSKKRKLKY